MASVNDRLKELNIMLPDIADPIASYVHIKQVGELLFLSGVAPISNNQPVMSGKVGAELDIATAQEGARLSIINALAVLNKHLGSLDRVEEIVKLNAYVAAAPSFFESHKVVNGASDLLIEVFGKKGKHARTAVNVPHLIMDLPIEIDLIVRTK